MSEPTLSLSRRIALAFGSFFAILTQPELAARIAALREGRLAPSTQPAPVAPAPATVAAPVPAPAPVVTPPPPTPVLQLASETAAWQLLGLLQREARFVDFIEEDIAAASDAEIGAVARVVHEGCRKAVRSHFTLEPVRSESEGSRLTLPAGFDAAAVRVTGNVVGQPPFTGTLAHRGWRVSDTRLPQLAPGHDARILAQAEVEL